MRVSSRGCLDYPGHEKALWVSFFCTSESVSTMVCVLYLQKRKKENKMKKKKEKKKKREKTGPVQLSKVCLFVKIPIVSLI